MDVSMASSQQLARETIRPLVRSFIDKSIWSIVKEAQTQAACDRFIKNHWPQLEIAALQELACAHSNLKCVTGTPSCMPDVAHEMFLRSDPLALNELGQNNPHGKGSKLRKIAMEAVERNKQRMMELADQLFEKLQTDNFACPEDIRRLALVRLNDLCLSELAQLELNGDTAPENTAKRHLKVLTVLAAKADDRRGARELFHRLHEANTSNFPFVLKYLVKGKLPVLPRFAGTAEISTSCINDALKAIIPEAGPLDGALNRYWNNNGFLSDYLDVNSEIAPELADEFKNLPTRLPTPGGILIPKVHHISLNRTERYSLPDGIACAVSLAIVLESILRQLQKALELEGSLNLRPKPLITKLATQFCFSAETLDKLEVVFGTAQIALRDAVAHGVFVANDVQSVRSIVENLSRTVVLLMEDISTNNLLEKFAAKPAWNVDYVLESAHEQTFEWQYINSHLLHLPGLEEIRAHSFRVFQALIPDKAPMCRASCLIWSEIEVTPSGNFPPGKLRGNASAELVGIIGALISIEELFRAVQELFGQRVLWPQCQDPGKNSIVMCRLSILDSEVTGLFNPDRLEAIFNMGADPDKFLESIAAVRALRDNVMHGGWGGLKHPKEYYLHLVVKLMFTVCSSVGIDNCGKTFPRTIVRPTTNFPQP
jgi:hypothetical protein